MPSVPQTVCNGGWEHHAKGTKAVCSRVSGTLWYCTGMENEHSTMSEIEFICEACEDEKKGHVKVHSCQLQYKLRPNGWAYEKGMQTLWIFVSILIVVCVGMSLYFVCKREDKIKEQ